MNAHHVYVVQVEGRDDPIVFAWGTDADDFVRAEGPARAVVTPAPVYTREAAAELIQEVSRV